MNGFLHSVQTLGGADGPGVRFVAFLQGCPLRCGCCHNPDTWALPAQGAPCTETTPRALLEKILRCRPFFGARGGVTVSGGEPLLQAAFVTELFTLCRAAGIHTCLDTSGFGGGAQATALLAVTDLVLLDIKYTAAPDYRAYVGCEYAAVLDFLALLQAHGIPTWLRQVRIPGKNDGADNLRRLAALAAAHTCVETVELLPFRKLCCEKYDAMGLAFPFADIPEAQADETSQAQAALDDLLAQARGESRRAGRIKAGDDRT